MTDQRLKQLRLAGPDKEPDSLKRRERAWTFLMTLAQDGDANAYLALLQEITPYLRFRVSMFFRDPRDVEDTVQDILRTIHAVRHTYDPDRSFGPWLTAIASRRAFDRLGRWSPEPDESSFKEAAFRTGMSVAALGMATFGALKSLRSRLSERGG